jgi:hypothetical protein
MVTLSLSSRSNVLSCCSSHVAFASGVGPPAISGWIRSCHGGNGDREPVHHHRRVIPDPAGDPARLVPAAQDTPLISGTRDLYRSAKTKMNPPLMTTFMESVV